MPTRDDWLGATWPFVATALPVPPGDVLEIGCGPLGGFVPFLADAGYHPVGIDPEAPEGPQYRRVEFEEYSVEEPAGAIVASTSLHHVHDLAEVLDKVAASLVPSGVLVVVEWDWQRFDEATAAWCFARLPESSPQPPQDASQRAENAAHGQHSGHAHADDESWLQHQRDEWVASGRSWDDHLAGWATEAGLHTGRTIIEELDRRFERELHRWTPYFFADLDDTSVQDEQAAIDAGHVRATGIHYVGRPRASVRRRP